MSTDIGQEALRRSYHPLRVARIVDETSDARSLVLEVPPALAGVFAYRAGQFVTLEVPHEGGRLRRCYSLASAPECDVEHKVTVKRVRDGRASTWLTQRLRVGDVLPVLPPEGRFVLSRRSGPLWLFAGGSGITPVISLLKSALATTGRPLRLVYANRDLASVIFRDELAELAARHGGRADIRHHLDDRDGLLQRDAVARMVREEVGADVDFYLCGPGPFMDTVEQGLTSAGVAPERLHVERFVSASSPAAGEPMPGGVAAVLDVELASVRHEVDCAPGRTLLQAARDAGLDAPYSCEEGFCGCCAAQVLEGAVHMAADDALTAADKARGLVLTCQARPLTARCRLRFVDI